MSAMAAGTRKQRRQETGASSEPHSTKISPAPMECEEFQMENWAANSRGATQ